MTGKNDGKKLPQFFQRHFDQRLACCLMALRQSRFNHISLKSVSLYFQVIQYRKIYKLFISTLPGKTFFCRFFRDFCQKQRMVKKGVYPLLQAKFYIFFSLFWVCRLTFVYLCIIIWLFSKFTQLICVETTYRNH